MEFYLNSISFFSIVEDFSTVCKSLITTYLGVSTVLLCATFLGLDVVWKLEYSIFLKLQINHLIDPFLIKFNPFTQALDNEGSVDVLRTICCLILCMNIPLVLCFNGDNVSTQFEEINNAFIECGFYQFPLNMQKLLPIMLMTIQKPVYICGYMNTHCTRAAYKVVIDCFLFSFWLVSIFTNEHSHFVQITKTGFSYFTMLRRPHSTENNLKI